MSSGEALISFPVVSSEQESVCKLRGNRSSEGRGESFPGTWASVIWQSLTPLKRTLRKRGREEWWRRGWSFNLLVNEEGVLLTQEISCLN